MRHLEASIVKKSRQHLDLRNIFCGGRGYGVNLQAGVLVLQLSESVVGFHRFAKRVSCLSKLVMKRGHSIQGKFNAKESEALFLQHFANRLNRSFRKIAVGRHINFLDAVLVYELTADRSEERRVGKECRSRWSP